MVQMRPKDWCATTIFMSHMQGFAHALDDFACASESDYNDYFLVTMKRSSPALSHKSVTMPSFTLLQMLKTSLHVHPNSVAYECA